MTTALAEEKWSIRHQAEFDNRRHSTPRSIYSDSFFELLRTSLVRYYSETEGINYQPDESVGDDVRALRQKILSQVTAKANLPSPPQVLQKLEAILASPDASAKDAADVIALDASICGRVLGLVNSSAYQLNCQVTTIEQAVAFLGMRKLHTLVMSASVMGAFSTRERDHFQPKKVWEHSLAVAAGTMLITNSLSEKKLASIDSEYAFLAGLMHDIGKFLIADQFADELRHIKELETERGVSRLVAELTVIGVDHADLGHELLSQWRLDPGVCAAVLEHHHPQSTLASAVNIANAIAHGLGFRSDSTTFTLPSPRTWAEIDLSNTVIEGIGYRVLILLDELKELLN